MAMKDAYSTKELVSILGMVKSNVLARAAREGWQSRPRPGRGGGKEWLVSSMPEATRIQIAKAVAESSVPAPITSSDVVIPDWANAIGLARFRLVMEWRGYCAKSKQTKAEASATFELSYRTGHLLPKVYEQLGEVAVKTIYRWDKALRENGDDYQALCDKRGAWTKGGPKGLGQIGEEAEELLLGAWLHQNQPSMMMAYNAAAAILAKRGAPIPTYSSARRFFQRYDAANHDIVVLKREGEKALRDTVGPYLARDDKILRVGDILFSDGHKLNFDAINPLTGKPARLTLIVWFDWRSRMPLGWEIMPEEDTRAIASALHMAIRNLGGYPRAVYIDNGKAYCAEYFGKDADLGEMDGLYARLGIYVHHSKPYAAQTKIIERFWGTFNEQCARYMPSYRGINVDDKPAYLKRAETYHKAHHSDYVPTIQEVAQIFSAFVGWYAKRPHRGIDGLTPGSIFQTGKGPGVDTASLERHFLLRRKVSPKRTGFTISGIRFESEALYGLNCDVMAMYSWADLSEVGLYDIRTNRKIGVAKPVEALNPLAAVFGDELDMQKVSEANKRQKALRGKTMELVREMDGKNADALESLPWMRPATERRQPIQMRPRQPEALPQAPELSEAEKAELAAIAEQYRQAEAAQPAYTLPEFFASELDKYAYLFEISVINGTPLKQEDAEFMTRYEASEEYRTTTGRRFEQLRSLYSSKERTA